MMREGQGEGHGEGWGDGKGDAVLDEAADFDKTEDFSKELDQEESLTDASGLAGLVESRRCRKPGQVWCPELGWLWWTAWWWTW